ncbi:ATP-dependent DNA ligase [Paractinoplanes toevensis]|uniref:ATP-dependent DNA ligase n=1 Tax=Paractinoplanes toevensis TaxID=571911 RepID=UPI001BB3BD1B|nr:ATP-dependent DNA ligase [Actinoplanes toevensis]
MAELPEPRMCRGGCAYEVKFDGWRCLAFSRQDGVYLQSRRAKDLTPFFPDVAAAVRETLPAGTVVDGELIIFDTEVGRTVFPALLGRITAGRRLRREAAARPANLVVFDVLAAAGDDLTGLPLRQRRTRLEQMLVNAPPTLVLCPQTYDVELARTWFDELGVTGAEGLVVKDLAGVYRVGGRGSTWWKYKRKVTVEAIVGGVIGAVEEPRALLLGRFDDHGRRLRYVARTVPLALSQRQEIGRMLTASGGVHQWPQPLPAAWIGQVDRREPQPYQQVEPLLVVEVVVDQAYDQGRYRHPVRLLRLRADVDPADVERWRP